MNAMLLIRLPLLVLVRIRVVTDPANHKVRQEFLLANCAFLIVRLKKLRPLLKKQMLKQNRCANAPMLGDRIHIIPHPVTVSPKYD